MISGEKIQKLADISLCNEFNSIIVEQIRNINQNIFKIDDIDPENIKNYKTIFVYTHCLIEFFNKFFKYLNPETVLITHNSDHCVDETFLKYLEDNTISKWYCQNRLVKHPKLFSIPIGIANSQWPHGNQDSLAHIRMTYNTKYNLVFKNFDKSTNTNERNYCDDITSRHGILMSQRVTNEEYWMKIATSMFVISPPGNGIDCHRIWECLYLKSVPVVLEHEALQQFKHLPILMVKSWHEVTIPFLQGKVQNYTNIDWDSIKELYIEYWRDTIIQPHII